VPDKPPLAPPRIAISDTLGRERRTQGTPVGLRALEAAGVEFTNGDEPGVKLKVKGEI
jgi:hypothetical protein